MHIHLPLLAMDNGDSKMILLLCRQRNILSTQRTGTRDFITSFPVDIFVIARLAIEAFKNSKGSFCIVINLL